MPEDPETEQGAPEDAVSADDPAALSPSNAPTQNEAAEPSSPTARAPQEPEEDRRDLAALELMLDVPLDVTVELGRTTMQLGEALALQAGSIIELNRMPGEPLDMHINDRLVARGEVVVVHEALGLRVTEIVGREPRRPRSSLVTGS